MGLFFGGVNGCKRKFVTLPAISLQLRLPPLPPPTAAVTLFHPELPDPSATKPTRTLNQSDKCFSRAFTPPRKNKEGKKRLIIGGLSSEVSGPLQKEGGGEGCRVLQAGGSVESACCVPVKPERNSVIYSAF